MTNGLRGEFNAAADFTSYACLGLLSVPSEQSAHSTGECHYSSATCLSLIAWENLELALIAEVALLMRWPGLQHSQGSVPDGLRILQGALAPCTGDNKLGLHDNVSLKSCCSMLVQA